MNSKLEILHCIHLMQSESFHMIEEKILNENDYSLLIPLLNDLSFESMREEMSNILSWSKVMLHLNDILVKHRDEFVGTIPSSDKFDHVLLAKKMILAILQLYSRLLHHANDKQLFHTYEIVAKFILSWDFDVADSASTAIYKLCVPSSTIASYASTEYELKDNIELPQSMATNTMAVFEGLGFLSPDYGVVDYMKSHIVPPYTHVDNEICIAVMTNTTSSKPSLKNVTISLNPSFETCIMTHEHVDDYQRLVDLVTSYQSTYELNDNLHMTMVLNVLRAASSLHGTSKSRLRIILLRLKCFYILIHSRLPIESMQSYISSGCTFLKDLIALSDLNSEVSSELKQAGLDQHDIASISCECILAMLSLVTRRRGVLLQQSGILQDLGLRQPIARGGRRDDDILGNLSQEVSWISIVSSAYNTVINQLHQKTVANKQHFSFDQHNPSNDVWKNSESYINACFELFILCVSTTDSQLITQMTPLVLSQAIVIRFALPHLGHTFQLPQSSDVPIARIIAKSLSSIEFVLEKMTSRGQPSPVSILQDCDFIATLQSLFEVIEAGLRERSNPDWPLFLNPLLTQVFSFISRYFKMNRRRMVSASDAGIHIIQHTSFAYICDQIFSSSCENQEMLWNELLLLLKEAVDIDPPFHTYLLGCTYFLTAIQTMRIQSGSESTMKVHEMTYSFARLIRVLCVSNEAHEFIYKHQLLQLIISCCLSPMSFLPYSSGLTTEALGLIGKTVVTTMRDVEKLRELVFKHVDTLLINISKEAHTAWETKVAVGEIPSINTSRMQILQKLTNVCIIEDSFHTELRRSSSGSRETFFEAKLTALVSAYTCTLPPSRQLFAQLGTRQAIQSTHYGHSSSAKAITTLLKSAASNAPQTLLPVVLKAIESTLIQISAQKHSLRGRVAIKEISSSLSADNDMFTMESIQKARKQRARGSSLGDDSGDIFILGILDSFPHKCSFDPSLASDFVDDDELERSMWKFLSSILYLEWLTFILSYTLRPSPYLHNRLLDKDILRRLFAFHKSSMMEVCRFSASKYKPKSIKDVHTSQSLGDNLAEYDSKEDDMPIHRIPGTYSLRVVSSVGALLREDCEIEGSRVVLLAENATICTAYERNQTMNGVVRYRTAHGWMSEYRKDSQSEILELIDVGISDNHDDDANIISSGKPPSSETQEQRGIRRLKEMMTIRESACYALTRINVTLRIVAMHLSHSVVSYQTRSMRSGRGSSDTLSPLACTVSKVLSKIVKGLFIYPFECLAEDEAPTSLESFVSSNPTRINSNNGTPLLIQDHQTPSKEIVKKSTTSSSSRRGSGGKSSSKMLTNNDTTVDSPKSSSLMMSMLGTSSQRASSSESISVNKASLCLYFESVAKYILIPILEDRNGNLNTHLLKYLQIYGGLEGILDAMLFVMACYYESSSDTPNLSPASQAALRALPSMMLVIRKLTQPKGIIQSQITLSMKSDPVPEKGNHDIYDLIHHIYSFLSEKLIPVMTKKFISYFPGDIQIEFYNIIFELRYNLGIKLPAPEKESAVSSSQNHSASLHDWLGNVISPSSSSSNSFGGERVYRNPPPSGQLMRELRSIRERLETESPPVPSPATTSTIQAENITPVGSTSSHEDSPASPGMSPDVESVVQVCGDMGFSRAHVLFAYEHTQSNNVETLMEYMINHPLGSSSNTISSVDLSALRAMHPDIDEDDLLAAIGDPDLLAALQMSIHPTDPSPIASVANEVDHLADATQSLQLSSPIFGSDEIPSMMTVDDGDVNNNEISIPTSEESVIGPTHTQPSNVIPEFPSFSFSSPLSYHTSSSSPASAQPSSSDSMEIGRTYRGLIPPNPRLSAPHHTYGMLPSPNEMSSLSHPPGALRPPVPLPSYPRAIGPYQGRMERFDRTERSIIADPNNSNSHNKALSIGKVIEAISISNQRNDTNYSDYATKEAELKAFLDMLNIDMISENFVDSCGRAIETLLTRGDGMPFITQLFQIIKKFSADAMPSIFVTLLEQTNHHLSHVMDSSISESSLYGLLSMILCYLRSSSTRSQLSFTKQHAMMLYHSLMSAVRSIASHPISSYPSWVSAALVVIYDLLSSVDSEEDVSPVYPSPTVESFSHSESKVEDVLMEEKSDDDNDDDDIQVKSSSDMLEKMSSWISDQVRRMDLLSRSCWVEIYQVVDMIIASELSYTQPDPLSSIDMKLESYQREVHQSVMLLLSLLVTDEHIRILSIEQNILLRIIKIPKVFSIKGHNNTTLLSIIVQAQLRSDAIMRHDLRHDMMSTIKTAVEQKNEYTLADLMKKIQSYDSVKIHPKILSDIILHLCEFYEISSTSSDVSGKNRILVRLKSDHYDNDKSYDKTKDEVNQSIVLLALLSHIYERSDDASTYSSANILNVLSDVLSSSSSTSLHHRLGIVFARLIWLDSSKLLSADPLSRSLTPSSKSREKVKTNFVDFLISSFYIAANPNPPIANGMMATTTQPDVEDDMMDGFNSSNLFILLLASYGGQLRKIALHTLVRSIKAYSHPSIIPGDEEVRLRVLTRLASLLPIIFKKMKTDDSNQDNIKSSPSIDILVQLFQAGIAETLTEALAFIPLRHPLSSDTINAILEPLEIFSRPPFQNLIQEQIKKRDALISSTSATATSSLSMVGAAVTSEADDMDSASDSSTVDNRSSITSNPLTSSAGGILHSMDHNQPPYMFMQPHNSSNISSSANQQFFSNIVDELQVAMDNFNQFDAHRIAQSQNNGGADSSSDDDDHRHHGGEEDLVDEDEDNEDEDGDEENEDNEGEEDEDDGDDGGDDDNDQGELVDAFQNISAMENMMHFEFPTLSDLNNHRSRGHDPAWQVISMARMLNNNNNNNSNNNNHIDSFVTPPDQIRADPLQVLMSELNSDRTADSPEEMIRRLINSVDQHDRMEAPMHMLASSMNNTGNRRGGVSIGHDINSQHHISSYHPLLAGADHVDASSNSSMPTHRPAEIHNDADGPTSMFAARHPYPRIPHILQRQDAMSRPMASVGVGASISNIMDQLDRDIISSAELEAHDVDSLNTANSLRIHPSSLSSSSADHMTSPSGNHAHASSRSSILAECFAHSLTSTITSLVIQVLPEPEVTPPSVTLNYETMNFESMTNDVNISQINPIADPIAHDHHHVSSDSSAMESSSSVASYSVSSDARSISPTQMADDSEMQDDMSEMTRTVGDLHTISSVNESIGDSLGGSYATEARSYRTVGESLISTSNLTSDAIPGRYDYDNVSMLSSIPTSESGDEDDEDDDGDDDQDNTTVGNIGNSPVFDLLPAILEEPQSPNVDDEDMVDAEVPEDNLIVEAGDVIIVEDAIHNDDMNEGNTNTVQSATGLECPQGYDHEVFNSLPESMQREIIDQYSSTNTQTRQLIENAGYDYEMFNSLPESIQQEILEQARRDQQPAASATSNDGGVDDNASFLLSLTPDLRAEILLTAEPAFLESLPPQLQAEAQQYRDQAARRIQEREIVRNHQHEREHHRHRAEPAVEMDDQYGDEDAPMSSSARRLLVSGNLLRSAIGSSSGRSSSNHRISSDGLYRIPNDDVLSLSLPLRLLAVVTKVLCSTTVKINVVLLQHLLYNLCKHPFTRDVSLRLLISLLANDAEMFKSSLMKLDITSSAAEAVYHLLLQSSDAFLLNNSRGCSLRRILPSSSSDRQTLTTSSADDMLLFGGHDEMAGVSTANAGTWTIPRHTLQSLILLLGKLFAENASTVYDILRPRHNHGGDMIPPSSTASASANDDMIDPIIASDTASSVAVDSNDPAIISPNITISTPIHHPLSPLTSSTNSLLEVLISLLSVDELTRNSSDLTSLTNLIAYCSAPLDITIKHQPKTLSPEEQAKSIKDRAEQDKAKHVQAVEVPMVIISSEALTNLCDILLSDLCSKRVFNDVSTVISRLTIIEANREVLLSLLVNVAEDLTQQSTSKLRTLCSILLQIHRDNHPIIKISSPRPLTSSSSSPSMLSPLATSTSRSQSNLSLIPTFELGGRQHDHLLRTLQTLVVIANKNKTDLNEVIPLASMTPLWHCLDEVLTYLREYVGNEDDDDVENEKNQSSSSSSSSSSSRYQSSIAASSSSSSAAATVSLSPSNSTYTPAAASLIFILTRLLPAVEALFMILTHDLLSIDDNDESSSRLSSPVHDPSPTRSASTPTPDTADPSTSSTAVGTNLGSLISSSTITALGGKHRKTKSYARMNINLYSDSQTGSAMTPYDESAMVNLQRTRSFNLPRSNLSAISTQSGNTRSHRIQAFALSHKNLLNLLIKSQPNLLEKSLSSMIRVIQLRPYLSFENKRKFFIQQLQASRRGPAFNSIHLRIRRDSVFEDSYEQLRSRHAEEWLGRFQIDFHGEQGIDAGGLTREFYNVLSREIFNPNYALFDAAADGATFQPNPSSNINSNHLSYFKFIGNVIGKAICDGHLMDAHFTRSFYKHVLGVPVDYGDIEATEPDYYKTLKQILDNPLEVLMIDLTFTAESHTFGKVEVVDLVPNGHTIAVTDENKFDYVRLIAHHRMTAAIKAQIESFLDGFYELVPPELICIFSPAELELLICGLPDVDIDNLKANTEYHGYRSSDDIIIWFWEALASFSRAEKAAFLQFVTGTSKVPLGGFANLQGMRGIQRCSIHKAYGDHTLLPTAHTCFNQLDLPLYTSAEELREKLLLAVKEGSEGFGFA